MSIVRKTAVPIPTQRLKRRIIYPAVQVHEAQVVELFLTGIAPVGVSLSVAIWFWLKL